MPMRVLSARRLPVATGHERQRCRKRSTRFPARRARRSTADEIAMRHGGNRPSRRLDAASAVAIAASDRGEASRGSASCLRSCRSSPRLVRRQPGTCIARRLVQLIWHSAARRHRRPPTPHRVRHTCHGTSQVATGVVNIRPPECTSRPGVRCKRCIPAAERSGFRGTRSSTRVATPTCCARPMRPDLYGSRSEPFPASTSRARVALSGSFEPGAGRHVHRQRAVRRGPGPRRTDMTCGYGAQVSLRVALRKSLYLLVTVPNGAAGYEIARSGP